MLILSCWCLLYESSITTKTQDLPKKSATWDLIIETHRKHANTPRHNARSINAKHQISQISLPVLWINKLASKMLKLEIGSLTTLLLVLTKYLKQKPKCSYNKRY